jgi:hypothetical protein
LHKVIKRQVDITNVFLSFFLEPTYIPDYYPFQTTGKFMQRYYARPGMPGRPGMAGRAAGPSGPGATPEFEIRTEFPETWIWKTFNTESE